MILAGLVSTETPVHKLNSHSFIISVVCISPSGLSTLMGHCCWKEVACCQGGAVVPCGNRTWWEEIDWRDNRLTATGSNRAAPRWRWSHHLSVLGQLFDISNDFLLLLLHLHALAVQVAHGLVECALVLAQHLLRRHAVPKQPLHYGILSHTSYLQ